MDAEVPVQWTVRGLFARIVLDPNEKGDEMTKFTYFVDGFELLYRVSTGGVTQMWKTATKTWGPELSRDKTATEASDIECGMGAWTVYAGTMPEGSVEEEEKHTCVFPLANAFTNWAGTWGCPECLTAWSWIKDFDDNGIWLDWTNHGHADMLTGFLK